MGKQRNQKGRFTPEHTDAEILAAVRAHEPAATSEVANEVGMTRQGADRRLRRLRDEGEVNSKKIGASLVWFAPKQDGEEGHERRDTPPEEPSRAPPAEPPPNDTRREAPESDAVDDALENVDFPAGRELEACSAAVYAARDYLREYGPATMREIVGEVMPEHSLGYDVDVALEKVEAGDRYRGAWWRRVVKPGLKALPEVDAPARGGSEWRYTGGA